MEMIEYLEFCREGKLPDIKDLSALVAAEGWEMWVARDWLKADSFRIDPDGPLAHGDVAVGWRLKNKLAPKFKKAIESEDRKKLDDWVAEGVLAAAMIDIHAPFNFDAHAPFDSPAAAKKQMGIAFSEHLDKTQSLLVMTVCSDIDFTATLLGIVGLMQKGLIYFPEKNIFLQPPSAVSETVTFVKQFPKG